MESVIAGRGKAEIKMEFAIHHAVPSKSESMESAGARRVTIKDLMDLVCLLNVHQDIHGTHKEDNVIQLALGLIRLWLMAFVLVLKDLQSNQYIKFVCQAVQVIW